MARRKFVQVDDRKLKKSLVPYSSDSEDDDNEGENHEEGLGWLWEKNFLSNKDDDYYSSSFPKEDYYHRQKATFYSRITNIQEYEDDDDDQDLEEYDYASPRVLDVKQKGICTSFPLEPGFAKLNIWKSSMEKGESSWSECALCHDDKPTGAMKQNAECGHFFCEDCMRVYVREKIQENSSVHIKIKCPKEKCNKHLGIQPILPYIPDEVFDRIVDARRESEVLANPTVIKCPLLYCSARFVDDCKGFKIRACPGCWRIFCVVCGVKWHMGKSCEQFQNEIQAQAQAQAQALNRARAALMLYRSKLEDDSPLIFLFK